MAVHSEDRDWRVTEERVADAVQRLVEAMHPLQIIAFGSRARGDHRVDSDLDLAVILDSPEEEVSPFGAYDAIDGIRMSVDILVASRRKFDLWRPWLNSVFHYIDQEGIILYDRDHPESASPQALHHSGGRPERSSLTAA
jgi:predicted nucleotidyltransferase